MLFARIFNVLILLPDLSKRSEKIHQQAMIFCGNSNQAVRVIQNTYIIIAWTYRVIPKYTLTVTSISWTEILLSFHLISYIYYSWTRILVSFHLISPLSTDTSTWCFFFHLKGECTIAFSFFDKDKGSQIKEVESLQGFEHSNGDTGSTCHQGETFTTTNLWLRWG